MARNLVFELGPDVVEKLQRLTIEFGEPSPTATIARALGLLKAIQPYLHGEGLLTIVDPNVAEDDMEQREVDLEFEGVAKAARAARVRQGA